MQQGMLLQIPDRLDYFTQQQLPKQTLEQCLTDFQMYKHYLQQTHIYIQMDQAVNSYANTTQALLRSLNEATEKYVILQSGIEGKRDTYETLKKKFDFLSSQIQQRDSNLKQYSVPSLLDAEATKQQSELRNLSLEDGSTVNDLMERSFQARQKANLLQQLKSYNRS
ncbi:hypothetical protein BLNAU_294 [Blattamonas nauphoetae]|uniref:Uncharacterized protein n=1 Tax=Blattamonas nauphoetae TaxID=2049346 RepID=A0ABQ9YML2_9EUKA|nr:hypothetical protein BLNAU_294 [Blattamonas nauphoetae]